MWNGRGDFARANVWLLSIAWLLGAVACSDGADPGPTQAPVIDVPDRPEYRTEVIVVEPENLIWPASSSPGALWIDGVEVWRGTIEANVPTPSAWTIRLSKPLPREGTIAVRFDVGTRSYSAEGPADAAGKLEIRCYTARRIEVDRNPGIARRL